jgi:hypothetical protein
MIGFEFARNLHGNQKKRKTKAISRPAKYNATMFLAFLARGYHAVLSDSEFQHFSTFGTQTKDPKNPSVGISLIRNSLRMQIRAECC